jgi:hypothetical protein
VPLVYTRYDGNVHVAGWLFTSFGVAPDRPLAASKLLDRIQPLHLASAAMARRDAARGDRRRSPGPAARRGRRVRVLRADGERAG